MMADINSDAIVFWTPPPAARLRPASQNPRKPSIQHSAASLASQSMFWPASRSQDDESLGRSASDPILVSEHENSDNRDSDDAQSDISSNTNDSSIRSTALEGGVIKEPFSAEMADPIQQMASSKEPPRLTLESIRTAASVPVPGQPPRSPAELLPSPSPAPLQTDQSTTSRVEVPTCKGGRASESGDTRSDIDQEAPEAATGSDPFELYSNEPRSPSHRPRRCDEDAYRESKPCGWCTRFPELSAMFKRIRKNRASRSEEAESLEAEVEPHSEKTVLDSVCLSHGPLYTSEDKHGMEYRPDGGQSPEHRSHASSDTNDPESLDSRGLDDTRDLNEEASGIQSLAPEHQLNEAGMDGSNDFDGQQPNERVAIRQAERNARHDNQAEPALAEGEQGQDKQALEPPSQTATATYTRPSGAGPSTRQLRPRIAKRVSFNDSNQEKEVCSNVQPQPRKRRRGASCSSQAMGAAHVDEEEDSAILHGSKNSLGRDNVDSDDEYRPASKRYKTASPVHNNTTQTKHQPKRGRRSVRQQISQSPPQVIPSPSSSPASHNETHAALAKFEEWPLQNVLLKRVIKHEGDSTDVTIENQRPNSRSERPHTSKKRGRAGKGTFASDEDQYFIELKELGLPWKDIYKRFTESFPGRSRGALQVRYCTKLKGRGSGKTSNRRGRFSQARV
ncbi:hypothetical protein F5Y16DRAFT_405865 [Xylariaceae sp. FL0255]|nr:hypothetical protein F5Y16DRAFT_405865 [Xylariaceae sp. FL0255]